MVLRTIAKYVAPPSGERPVKTYELYAKTRELAETITWEKLLEAGAVICGDRDHCIEQLAKIQKAYGVTQILCWTRLGALDGRKVTRSMELMQKYVMPHFKSDEKRAAA